MRYGDIVEEERERTDARWDRAWLALQAALDHFEGRLPAHVAEHAVREALKNTQGTDAR